MAPSLSLLICDLGVMTHPSQGGGEIWRLAPARQCTSVEPLSEKNVEESSCLSWRLQSGEIQAWTGLLLYVGVDKEDYKEI